VTLDVLQNFRVKGSKVKVKVTSQHEVMSAKISYIINNSATDCSISVKFGTESDHVKFNVLQTFKVKCQRSRSQCEHIV